MAYSKCGGTGSWGVFNTYYKTTPVDIVAITELYGRKPKSSLVGVGGRCLDVKKGKVTEGAALQTYYCDSGNNQKFDNSPFGLRPLYDMTELKVKAKSTATGTQATLQSNSGYGAFVMSQFQIIGLGGLCLTDHAGSYVRMEKCDGSTAQLWKRNELWKLQSVASDKCLRKIDGNYLGTGNCASSPDWFTSNGRLLYDTGIAKGNCADVKGGYAALKTSEKPYVQTYSCKSDNSDTYLNQRWIQRGQFKLNSDSSKCLDVSGNTSLPGAKAQVYPCHDGANQLWDYYF
jgi:hypothetical protein